MENTPLSVRVSELISKQESLKKLPSGAGIAVSAVKNGRVVFKKTYGLRERDQNLPVTSETLFEICSSTKAFTSTAFAMASERINLDLDSPINATQNVLLFKDVEVTQKVSFVDILSHRTGLPSYDLLWYLGTLQSKDLLHTISGLDLPPNAFRESFTYNNILYGALSHVFKAVFKESWESFVTKNIFNPLKMTSTCFRTPSVGTNVALPYVGTQRVKRAGVETIPSAGAMLSNIEDMSRWIAFQLNGGKTPSGERLLSDTSMSLMHTKQIEVKNTNPLLFQGLEWLGPKISYGLGWFLGSTRGLKAVFHPGYIDGFSTAIVMIPEKQMGFVALSNINLNDTPGLLIHELLKCLLDETQPKRNLKTTGASKLKNASLLGKYENPIFGTICVEQNESNLFLNYNGNIWPLKWKDKKNAEFLIDYIGLQLPLTVQFETKKGKTPQLSIPLSMDARVKAQTFTRTIK